VGTPYLGEVRVCAYRSKPSLQGRYGPDAHVKLHRKPGDQQIRFLDDYSTVFLSQLLYLCFS